MYSHNPRLDDPSPPLLSMFTICSRITYRDDGKGTASDEGTDMTVKLMSAVIVGEYSTTSTGSLQLATPRGPILVDEQRRAPIERGEVPNIVLHVQPFSIVLMLWGKREGTFQLSHSLTHSTGDTIWGGTETKTWTAGAVLSPTVIEVPALELVFARSGLYGFKFLADGDPLGTVSLPIFWRDEFPP